MYISPICIISFVCVDGARASDLNAEKNTKEEISNRNEKKMLGAAVSVR